MSAAVASSTTLISVPVLSMIDVSTVAGPAAPAANVTPEGSVPILLKIEPFSAVNEGLGTE